MLKAKTKQNKKLEQNKTKNRKNTNQVNKEQKAKEKDFRVGVGEGRCQRSSALYTPLQKTLQKIPRAGGLHWKFTHKLGKIHFTGHIKIQNINSCFITSSQSPKKKVGPTAPCD